MKIDIKVEAMMVPTIEEHEAAKDYEAKLMKVCAWLDAQGAEGINFDDTDPKTTIVSFSLEDNDEYEIQPGFYIVFLTPFTVVFLSQDELGALLP